MSCSCSRYCRKHGGSNIGGFSEIGYNKAGIHKGVSLTSDTKALLCRLVNDKALKMLCRDTSLMVDLLTEQTYDTQSRCLGLNEDAKNIYIVLKDTDDNKLPYTDIIAIILHELVHHTYREHDEDFIELEKTYREKYIKYAQQTGLFPSWTKIEFPESTGATLKLNNFSPNVIGLNARTVFVVLSCIAVYYALRVGYVY